MKFYKSLILTVALVMFCFGETSCVQAMSNYIPGAHSVTVRQYDDITTNNPAIGG